MTERVKRRPPTTASARSAGAVPKTVRVDLGERSYRICVARGAIGRAGPWIEDLEVGGRLVVMTNRKVADLYGKKLEKSLRRSFGRRRRIEVVTMPDGERYKNLATVEKLYDRLLLKGADRQMLIVALGGGVVGDIAGFVAATVLRGVRFVQVPTTLLAQVDSSVGGKTGVNTRHGKNLVGVFHQPCLVVADPDTLVTLSARQYRAGLAEVVKYGVIASRGLFALLERRRSEVIERDGGIMTEIVARCCRLKAGIVAEDETEAGLRRVLNFGHTIGHAIEKVTGYRRFLHGEAVALGMVAAAKVSERLGACEPTDVERLESLIEGYGLPSRIPSGVDASEIASAIGFDKKVAGSKVRFILAEGIGRCRQEALSPRTIARVLE